MERQFYETHYSEFIEKQNERNAKIRHTERNRSISDLLSGRKTCPEETIYQLGTLDEHASAEDLLNIVTEFIEEFKGKFGEHVHVLDWALHLDESTPHIHERHVFDCENKYGEVAPQQEKALEALGFDLPDPAKPSAAATIARSPLMPPVGKCCLRLPSGMGWNWRKKRSTATANIWKNRTSSSPSRRSNLPPSKASWTN